LVNGNPLDHVTVLGVGLIQPSAAVCYHPATVRPGTIHHAEA
jgi:hypothetical protein